MAMELIRIRTAQKYPMLMPTLFPGNLATRKRPYDSLATLWTVFAHLKHDTSPAIDGDAFSPANKGLSSYTRHVAASSNSPITSPNRSTHRFGRQDTAPGIFNLSNPFPSRSVRRRLWPMTLRRPRLRHSLHVFFFFFSFFLFSLISLIADGPHHYHPACGHKGSSHLSPVHALQFFYRDASSALLQLVNQWLNFTYSRSHAFRYERKNTNPILVRIELTTSALAGVQITY